MNTQDDSIDRDELIGLSEDDDKEREPSTYKIWVHIEGIDEDGEPIDGDADLPTEICEVDTLDEATDVVAKLEAVDVFETTLMPKIETMGQLREAVRKLLDYNWEDERKDFNRHEGDGEAHIFTTMQALDEWIDG